MSISLDKRFYECLGVRMGLRKELKKVTKGPTSTWSEDSG
jgi:hypothetical protein